ncbi:MAG: hypothetical protein U5L45_15175 [Saprospiraceae bacterium]|nr:hypothetical protein [Saprospiraceae bacterium]
MWFIFRRSRKMNHLFFRRCASKMHEISIFNLSFVVSKRGIAA